MTKTGGAEEVPEVRAVEIWKSTRLVDFQADLTSMAHRLFAYAISELQPELLGPQKVTVRLRDMAQAISLDHNSFNKDVEQAADLLLGTKVKIPEFDRAQREDGWTKCTLVSAVTYRKRAATLTLTFAEELTSHLVGLGNRFTKYELREAMAVKGKYAFRLYELAKSRERDKTPEGLTKPWRTQLRDLRLLLGIAPNEYPAYADLKRRVLEPARKQISEKTRFRWSYREIKKERAVVAIEFRLAPKGDAVEPVPNLSPEPTPPPDYVVPVDDPDSLARFKLELAERRKQKESSEAR